MAILYIDLNDGQLNIAYAGDETYIDDDEKFELLTTGCPSIVSLLDDEHSYLVGEPSYTTVNYKEKEYGCMPGVEIRNATVLNFSKIDDFIQKGDEGIPPFLALLQYLLNKLGVQSPISEINFKDVSLMRYESSINNRLKDNNHIEYNFINRALKSQSVQIKPAERTLSVLLKDTEDREDIIANGNIFVKLYKDSLTLYTTDVNGDLIIDDVSITDQISILALFEELKNVIRNKTGLHNMPLGESILFKALANGYLGSTKSGMYVDLRDEVNTLLNSLASNIVEALYTYASGGHVFGSWYFTGYLSDSLYEKIHKILSERYEDIAGVQCSITHLPGGHQMLVNAVARQFEGKKPLILVRNESAPLRVEAQDGDKEN